MRCGVVWCGVVYGVVWCGVVWCGVVWCGVVGWGVVWCGEVCGEVWGGVVWCGVVYGVVWCGVVWCGVVWCGVVWCGVGWCGVVWCGVFYIFYSHYDRVSKKLFKLQWPCLKPSYPGTIKQDCWRKYIEGTVATAKYRLRNLISIILYQDKTWRNIIENTRGGGRWEKRAVGAHDIRLLL